MSIPLNQSPLDILIALVNNDNGLNLEPDFFDFSDPVVTDGVTPPRNTRVVMSATPVPGFGYTGSVPLYYNRLPIDSIPGIRSKEFVMNDAVMVSDIIDQINQRFEILLVEGVDYIDAPLPDFSADLEAILDFTLTVPANCKIYTGELTLQLRSGYVPDPDLSEVITQPLMAGLVFPQTML